MFLGANAYAFLGLTALVGGLTGLVVFALARFMTASRETRRRASSGGESALLSSALEEALVRLKAQQRETTARAEASERLTGEIMASLTAGLLVVGMNAEIRILNPAGRRMLGDHVALDDYRTALA